MPALYSRVSPTYVSMKHRTARTSRMPNQDCSRRSGGKVGGYACRSSAWRVQQAPMSRHHAPMMGSAPWTAVDPGATSASASSAQLCSAASGRTLLTSQLVKYSVLFFPAMHAKLIHACRSSSEPHLLPHDNTRTDIVHGRRCMSCLLLRSSF